MKQSAFFNVLPIHGRQHASLSDGKKQQNHNASKKIKSLKALKGLSDSFERECDWSCMGTDVLGYICG